jgi:proline iminopeptidase
MQDSIYLGELGGLSAHRQLIMMGPRGSGQSATPEDAASYRCDRLVDDVEALREHLDLDPLDLLSHSAGTNLAALYVGRHPEQVRSF